MKRLKSKFIFVIVILLLCGYFGIKAHLNNTANSPLSSYPKNSVVSVAYFTQGARSGDYLVLGESRVRIYTKGDRLLDEYRINNTERIISAVTSDLDWDSNEEILLLTGKRGEGFGKYLMILSYDSKTARSSKRVKGEFTEIYRHSFAGLKPWKVQTADVDGDRKKEISLGVYKTARFHPVPAKRPFLYNWEGGGLSPKWLGSRLSRPFEDYIFADLDSDGMDELVSVEVAANREKLINTYKWKGFGFEGMGESERFQDISNIMGMDSVKAQGAKIKARVRKSGIWKWVVFEYKNGSLRISTK